MLKLTNEEFIDIYSKKFPNIKFDKTNYTGMQHPITVECKIHGEIIYNSARSFMKSKYGCRECSRESQSKTTEQFIEEAKKIYPYYDWSIAVYKNEKTKVQYICPKHGIKEATPSNILHNRGGCKECSNEKISKDRLIPEEEIIKKSKEIFGDIFKDYEFIYLKNKRRRIAMTCIKHNYRFSNSVGNHINLKQGCKLCAMERQKAAITKTAEIFLEDCKNKFGELYSLPELSTYYKNEETILNIKCNRCGNTFKRRANAFLNQNFTCPFCDCSKAEVKILSYLQKNNIIFEHNYRKFKDMKYKDPLEIDFWLPELNIAIEAQGIQHYIDNGWKEGNEFKVQQTRDQIKREYCREHGIEELEIPYWEFDNIEEILKCKLNL